MQRRTGAVQHIIEQCSANATLAFSTRIIESSALLHLVDEHALVDLLSCECSLGGDFAALGLKGVADDLLYSGVVRSGLDEDVGRVDRRRDSSLSVRFVRVLECENRRHGRAEKASACVTEFAAHDGRGKGSEASGGWLYRAGNEWI
jgi:hypothetical protein